MIKNVIIIGDSDIAISLTNAISLAGLNAKCIANKDLPNSKDSIGKVLTSADLVFVATADNFQEKQALIVTLDNVLKENVVIAVQTIIFDLSVLTGEAKKRSRIAGMRFIGAEYVTKHVEITKTICTEEKAYIDLREFAESFIEKVIDAPDIIGGIFYRIMPVMPNMASCMLLEGISAEDIDKAMIYGSNAKIGPLHLADEFGLDNLLELLICIYEDGKDPAYRPSPILKNFVSAGLLGKKTGRGFFEYVK